MDFALNEEQEMLKTAARDFLKTECPESLVREIEEDDLGYSPDLWRKMAEMGWLGIIFPTSYGGIGGTAMDLCVLHEEMGRAMLPSPYLSTVELCGLTILAGGSDEHKKGLLPQIAKGDLIIALALTEPDAVWNGKGWDPEGVTVPAASEGDNYVISGTKMFIHDAHIADYLLCVARTKDTSDHEDGITLFLVDARTPGISCTLLKTVAGDKQYEVVFDRVSVPKSQIIGELHKGWLPLSHALRCAAVMLCAEMEGAGQRIAELTVDYAKSRVQFDLPIGINQFVQEHCCNLFADVQSSRNVTYQAAWMLSEGLTCDFEVSMAKAWTDDAIERAAWAGHQVFAGVGYTADDGLMPLYSRRLKSAQLYLGDSAYHLEKIAQYIEDQWPAPDVPKGKPLGLWEENEEEQMPSWEPWRKRKEDRLKKKKERTGKT